MKEFNLEEAKAGKPVCTRDGRHVRIICYDRIAKIAPIVALVKSADEETEGIVLYRKDGRADSIWECGESKFDLFMVDGRNNYEN